MKIKKILPMLLCIAMIFTLSVNAFAAEAHYRPYTRYFGIGDSIGRGYGLSGYTDDSVALYAIDGCFEQIVGDTVGCGRGKNTLESTQRYMMTYAGMRSKDVLYALGESTDRSDEYSKDGPGNFGTGERIVRHREEFIDWIKYSDLITVEVGSNDVFYAPFHVSGLEDGDISAASIAKCLDGMRRGYEEFCLYYPRLLKYIRDNNTVGADVVLVGVYNPDENFMYLTDTLIPVGNLLSVITSDMNAKMRAWASEYGFLYANVQNAETPANRNDHTAVDFSVKNATHPTPAGYEYMARQILSVLPKENGPVYGRNDIVIDLGNYDRVISVLVDDAPMRNYDFDGHVLHIPYRSCCAKTLTVTAKKDGKVSLYLYQLVYKNGYTVYRVIGSSNVASVVSKVVTNTVNIVKTLGGLFKG